MTVDIAAIRARLYASEQSLPQVAYSARDAGAALGVPGHRVWLLIRDGELPARRRGQRYLISGAIILDILGEPHPAINDPRKVIDPDRAFYLSGLAALLGLTYGIAQRLSQDGHIKPDRYMGTRPLFYGRTILAFLNGADELMRSSQSA